MQFMGSLHCGGAVGIFVFAMGAAQTHPDWTISTPTAIVGAFVIWSIGRAIRYILNRR
jgi:hypothetical protein